LNTVQHFSARGAAYSVGNFLFHTARTLVVVCCISLLHCS